MNNTNKRTSKSSTKIRANGRVVGKVVGNQFLKNIKTDWILRKPPAIANDIQALHNAERAGAEYCCFTCTDTGIIYRAPIAKIWDLGFTFNRGFGEQVGLSLSHWSQDQDPNHTNRTDPPPYSPAGTTETPPMPYEKQKPTQTSFWG
ncbi:MAG: hypothetical protein HYZ25_19180 [Chloroflexi bacterium]|nr:hypothetical protein [Chloroflexota bacterium]